MRAMLGGRTWHPITLACAGSARPHGTVTASPPGECDRTSSPTRPQRTPSTIRSCVYSRERLSAAPPNTLPWVRGTGPTPLCSPHRAHLAMDAGCSAPLATLAPWAQASSRLTAAVATVRLAAGYSPLLSVAETGARVCLVGAMATGPLSAIAGVLPVVHQPGEAAAGVGSVRCT
jgi:hypothetical protein